MFADNIKKISLYLENCEIIDIERKHIGQFVIAKIEREILRMERRYIGERFSSKEIALEFHAAANKECYDIYGIEKRNIFDRILGGNDIAHVIIHYNDIETSMFTVDYDEGERTDFLICVILTNLQGLISTATCM